MSKWRFSADCFFRSISSETPYAPRKILANQKYCKPALAQRDPRLPPAEKMLWRHGATNVLRTSKHLKTILTQF